MSASGKGKVENIQALRAIAALLVLSAHLKFCIAGNNFSGQVPHWLESSVGGCGVDIFFVISGFVVSLSADQQQAGAGRFFWNRLTRVAPFYSLTSIACLLLMVVKGRCPEFSNLWNSFFYLPLFDVKEWSVPVNNFGWSLSFEMWFYTLFAALLLKFSPGKTSVLLPVLLGFGVLMGYVFDVQRFCFRFMLHPLGLEFALGCLIYRFRRHLTFRIAFCGFVLTLLSFITLVPAHLDGALDNFQQSWERVVYWGLPAGLVVIACVGLESSAGIVAPKFLVALGEISFSMYLIQPLVIMVGSRICWISGMKNPFVAVVFCVTLLILSAYLSWRFCERPLTRLARRLWTP